MASFRYPLRRFTAFGACSGAAYALTSRSSAHNNNATGSRRPILFFSDLDGTLHGESAEAQRSIWTWAKFWQQTEAPLGSVLCYNTGRCITDYYKELQPQLPVPDVLITGDGGEVRWRSSKADANEPRFEMDEQWAANIRSCWEPVREALITTMARDDEHLIPDINAISNSPPHGESRYAITVLGEEKARALSADYAQQFAGTGVEFYIMCGWVPNAYLVVALPGTSGKANAAQHVQRRLGFADGACVAAGDSSNDISMVHAGYRFIMVANANGHLVEVLDAAARPTSLHFRASGTHAKGVTEGLLHFRRLMDGAHDHDHARDGASAPGA